MLLVDSGQEILLKSNPGFYRFCRSVKQGGLIGIAAVGSVETSPGVLEEVQVKV